jgi:RHS repeat-associated protein
MHRVYRCLSLAILAVLAEGISHAQVATGMPPFGSFGGGPDVINLANLNSHMTVPVLNKAGRGILPFTYNLSYDSSVWYPVGVSGSQSWQPVANWGWRGQTEVATGYVSYWRSQRSCRLGTRPDWYWVYWNIYTYTAYNDQFGVSHPFNLVVVDDNSTCPGSFNYATDATGTTSDGSGYTMHVSGAWATVYPPSGGSIVPPMNSGTGNATVTDRNGNQITVNGSVFTDTLGTTALTVSGSGTPSSPVMFSYAPPSGGSVAVKMNYTQYTVRTYFQVFGIADYGRTSIALVSSVVLPDNSQYSFTYEATPSGAACTPLSGTSSCVTGRIASIALPTGGQITYSYSGGNSGILSDGSTATLTRQTPDGTWTYARTPGSGAAYTTTITDPTTPTANQTVIQFQGLYETQRQVYQGSSTSGTLLETVNTCYNGNTTNCTSAAVGLPITQRTVFTQLPDSSGRQSESNIFYNTFGLVTEDDEYDFLSGAVWPLVRKTLISYASLGGIVDMPGSVTIQDSGGHISAQTTFGYDQTAVTPTSGTPQHVSISGSRGNLTTVSYLVQGLNTLNRTFTYYDTGALSSVTDINGAAATYTYGACGNSFLTSVSLPLNLSRAMTWDSPNCTGGVKTSVTDENSSTVRYAFNDLYFWRVNSVTDAAQNTTNFFYVSPTNVNPASMESSMVFNGTPPQSTVDVLKTLDGLGRIQVTQVKQSPSSSNYDSIETDYDSLGRPRRVTLPYSKGAGQTNSSGPAKNTSYDALGRPTQITDSGGGSTTVSYTQNDALRTVGPAPTGENAKRRQLEYDALGRLSSVCELTAGTTLSPGGNCGQNAAQTGYWTKYSYDAVGNLTSITQNAQSSTTQTRSYSYDGLARLTTETNPESGTTNYTYDTDSTCGTSNGDLVKRVDAVGNATCYAYDALHRVTSVSYSGPYATNTPQKHFTYDSATINVNGTNVTMANTKGRLAEAYSCFSPCTTKITDIGFSYSARGETTDVYESTSHSGGYYHVSASYWASGTLNQLSNLTGLSTLTYGADGEGRINTVSATGQNPVSSTQYNITSPSKTIVMTLGSGDTDTFTYDSNTDRMTQYQFSVNGQSVTGTLGWNANGTLGGLNITDPFNSANTQNCTYGHDDMTRISSANCGSAWSQTFAYDAFGNISKSGSSVFQPTYSSVTNHYTLPGVTVTYDANGNLLTDSVHSYAWDAAGQPTTIDAVGATYDAIGRMVEQNRNGAYTELVYSPGGSKLALMNGQTLQKAFVPLPAAATAVYSSAGLSYYRHPDWLGNSRLASTPSRTMYSDVAYAPFGETYAQAGATDLSFTGQNQDTAAGLYDFPFREYSIQGRWPSPDPAGLAAASLSDPQSLNRYAYARNDPTDLTDPLGLCTVVVGGLTQSPGSADTGAQQAFASDLVAIQVFPYAGTDRKQGVGEVQLQSFGVITEATNLTRQGIEAAAADGSVDIIAYSGGAGATVAAISTLAPDVRQKIRSITFLSPGQGTGPETLLTPLHQSVFGTGLQDALVTFNSKTLGAINSVDPHYVDCPHSANCEFGQLRGFLLSRVGSAGCSQVKTITRGGGGGGGGSGGSGWNGYDNGPTLVEECDYDGENYICTYTLSGDWGGGGGGGGGKRNVW